MVGLVVAVLLTSCSLPDGAAPVPPTSAASEGVASGDPSTAPSSDRATVTQALAADGIELVLTVPLGATPGAGGADGADGFHAGGEPVAVTPDEDGSSRVAFVLPSDEAATVASSGSTPTGTTDGTDVVSTAVPATIDLVSPADGSLVRNSDGSVTVLDAAGTPLGGLSAPEATETSGPAGRAGVVVVAPTRAEVHVKARGAAPSGTGSATGDGAGPAHGWTVTTWLGAQGVRSATWGEREGGRSLAVDPTPWARQSGIVGEATAWAQLVASEPEAASRTMRDQFDCHALGATDKTTWNLEPWRPDVGFLATAAARCNPTT
ncbi:DUF2599 domain-containing protein [Actinotalea fermentans ATCC 43279 = JCM 9966 = DSM 3133]|nr:DUF2599 domain-containing protein [Actinotalea fermentans ATCC 43279 = JCM 9966 = DSM 3133]